MLLVHGRLLGVDCGDELGEVRLGAISIGTAIKASAIIIRVVLVPGVAAVGAGEADCGGCAGAEECEDEMVSRGVMSGVCAVTVFEGRSTPSMVSVNWLATGPPTAMRWHWMNAVHACSCSVVFCQVVIGQCGVSFPSEKAVGFSPVRNWPVIARVLLSHCIRA